MLRLMRATVDINAVRRKIEVVPNGVFTVEALKSEVTCIWCALTAQPNDTEPALVLA